MSQVPGWIDLGVRAHGPKAAGRIVKIFWDDQLVWLATEQEWMDEDYGKGCRRKPVPFGELKKS